MSTATALASTNGHTETPVAEVPRLSPSHRQDPYSRNLPFTRGMLIGLAAMRTASRLTRWKRARSWTGCSSASVRNWS